MAGKNKRVGRRGKSRPKPKWKTITKPKKDSKRITCRDCVHKSGEKCIIKNANLKLAGSINAKTCSSFKIKESSTWKLEENKSFSKPYYYKGKHGSVKTSQLSEEELEKYRSQSNNESKKYFGI